MIQANAKTLFVLSTNINRSYKSTDIEHAVVVYFITLKRLRETITALFFVNYF